MSVVINVNGVRHRVQGASDTPLLYVLRDEVHLRGPRFGCGLAQCGACAVLMDGKEIRSCVTPATAVAGHQITTVEGLPALYKGPKTETGLHPVQEAWIDEQVPQCGFCQSGMVIQAVDLLSQHKNPTDALIRTAMNAHLCRCATHNSIIRAIKRAAKAMD